MEPSRGVPGVSERSKEEEGQDGVKTFLKQSEGKCEGRAERL